MESKYPIKKYGEDFNIILSDTIFKGTRYKEIAIDKKQNKAFFKYQPKDYMVSESASEKIAYELAKALGYKCAKIEFAQDIEGNLGVLNYFFITSNANHIDAILFLKNEKQNKRAYFYTVSNIKAKLDNYNKELFKEFIKIMIFDALIGEQDRHEENWGLMVSEGKYNMSPLYDNGCSLLREFKNEKYAQKYYNKIKDFDSLIKKSKTYIYKENHQDKYKHFELIEYLLLNYEEYTKDVILKLNELTLEKVEDIVQKVPDDILTSQHKIFIVKYILRRKNILLKMVG